MGGTIGWIVVSWPFIFLLSANAGPDQVRLIFVVAAIVSFAFAAYSLTLPHTPPKRDAADSDPLAWRKAIKLLGIPSIAVLFIVTFIDSVVHNGYFVMADGFLTNRVGIDANLSMIVLSIGQVAEIVTMFILGFVLIRLGWKTTMIIGILGHAARFLAFAFFPDSIPTDHRRAAAARHLLRVLLRDGLHLRRRRLPEGCALQRAGPVQPADPRHRQRGGQLPLPGADGAVHDRRHRAGHDRRLPHAVHGSGRHGVRRRPAAGLVLPAR